MLTSKKTQKSIIAPTAFKEFDKHLILGSDYVKNYLLLQAPDEYGLGLMSYYLSNPSIRVYQVAKKFSGEFLTFIKKEYNEKTIAFSKETDETAKERIRKEVESLDRTILDIVRNNDRVLDVTIVFSISASNLDELEIIAEDFETQVASEGMKIACISLLQADLLKVASPLFIDDDVDPEVKINMGIPLTTTNYAGLWPFMFQSLKHKNGFLFGREKNSHGMIKFHPFYWLDNPDVVSTGITAGNIVIFGKTGFGKSVDLGLIVRHLFRSGVSIVWVDPENKNQYLTKLYGGTYIQWGIKGNIINIFDLKPIIQDAEDEGTIDEESMWDTEMAMYDAIDQFKILMKLYAPHVEHQVYSHIDSLMIKMYANKGITFDKPFKDLKATDYPIISDFVEVLQERMKEIESLQNYYIEFSDLSKLNAALIPMLHSHNHYFNGHTSINPQGREKKIISFGTKILKSKDKNLRDALNHIMFKYAWSVAVSDDCRSATIYDEGQEFILEGNAAPELAQQARLGRKRDNIMIYCSQEPRDLQSEVLVNGVQISVHGKTIMNNATYKIYKYLEKDARNSLMELVDLNDAEVNEIAGFVRGDALFQCGNEKYIIEVFATEQERQELDPKSVRRVYE